MNDSDMFAFMEIFRSVTRVFPMRGDEHEIRDIGASYFKAMRRFPIERVRLGAEACTQRLKRVPKPADWIDLIPQPSVDAPVVELQALARSEWLDAEAKHWEGSPCGCGLCRQAGVDHRFLRFVPECDSQGVDRHARIGERTVTKGHWAHGEELQRYYAAKDAFWVMAHGLGWKSSLLHPPERPLRRTTRKLVPVAGEVRQSGDAS